jgi:cell wall-associated NlpC family hydrolase
MISQTARVFCKLIGILAVISVSGCASQQTTQQSSQPPSRPPVQASAPASPAEEAVSVAMLQIGVPYRYGGASPQGFDCSGLVYYSYSRAGKSLPRTTATLWSQTRPVEKNDIRVGDILFFHIAGKMSHVGLYIGDDRFVHAPESGKVVTVANLNSDFYDRALIRAGRPY